MGGSFHIKRASAGEGSNDGAADCLTDGTDGLEVAFGGDGEASLQNVHPEIVERVGHLDLFRCAHAATGGLFAVTQRGVKEYDPVLRGSRRFVMRHVPSSTASSVKRIHNANLLLLILLLDLLIVSSPLAIYYGVHLWICNNWKPFWP